MKWLLGYEVIDIKMKWLSGYEVIGIGKALFRVS